MSDWIFFDNLPPRLRKALAGAAFDYDAEQFYKRVQEGFSVTSLCNYIRECDLGHALADQVTTVGNRQYRVPSSMAVTKVRPLYT